MRSAGIRIAVLTAVLTVPTAWAQTYNCLIDPGGPGTYSAGDVLTMVGDCSDENGNSLPASQLQWKVYYKVDTSVTIDTEATGISELVINAKANRGEGLAWYQVTLTGQSDQGNVTTATQLLLPASGEFKFVTVSDMPALVEVANGLGPMERNTSVGEEQPGDGNPISLRGGGYAKGLGVHPGSEVHVPLPEHCPYFVSDFGVDDEKGGAGSVIFKVMTDDKLVFTSDLMTGIGPVGHVEVKIPPGTQEMRLLVEDGGDGDNADHADWAGAFLICKDGNAAVTTKAHAAQRNGSGNGFAFTAAASGRSGMHFRFQLPEASHAVLELRDYAGRLLAKPMDKDLAKGRHDLDWAPGAAFSGKTGGTGSAGIVFAVLKCGSRQSVRTIIGGNL